VEENLRDGDSLLALGPERRKDRRNRVVETEPSFSCEFQHREAHRRFDCGIRVKPRIVTRIPVRLGEHHLAFETDGELEAGQTAFIHFATGPSE